MQRSNEQTLKEVVRELLKAYRWGGKILEIRLMNSWENVVGKMISKHTLKLDVRKKVLYVKLDSPALKNELSYAKERIIKSLNEEVGEDVINKIVFT
ncbi:MAG: DUF721 domain-containing protein [Bacteroidales bacterium]|nr:DUF721 domain-containing protein [Bacteroidales bacterium]